jgi:hypothetical protein
MSNTECDLEVYKNGISVGLFDMPKEEAEAMCEQLTKDTGRKHDWHYIGGRVHVKALPEPIEQKKDRPEALWA